MSRDRAFDEEVIAHLPALRAFARSLTRDPVSAEDMTQSAVEKALRNAEKFETGTNLAAWLITILRNEYLTQIRKRRREVEDADGTIAGSVPVSGGQQASAELRDIRRRFRTMPKEWRDCLIRIVIGDQYDEIAADFGIPIGTVKSRVSRARAYLGGGNPEPEDDATEPEADIASRVTALFEAGRSASEIIHEVPGADVALVMKMAMTLKSSRRRQHAREAA